jgi:hypothetical protein
MSLPLLPSFSQEKNPDCLGLTPASRLMFTNKIMRDQGLFEFPGVKKIAPLHDEKTSLAFISKVSIYDACMMTDDELTQVRNFFGDDIGWYFAFFTFYTKALMVPAIVGTVVYIIKLSTEIGPGEFSDTYLAMTIPYGLLNIVWYAAVLNLWKRKQDYLAFRWEIPNEQFSKDSKRPDFEASKRAIDAHVDQRSWITEMVLGFKDTLTNRITGNNSIHPDTTGDAAEDDDVILVDYYPWWKRGLKKLVTVPICIIFDVVVLFGAIATFAFEIALLYTCDGQAFIAGMGAFGFLFKPLPDIIFGLVIDEGLWAAFVPLSLALAKWENYQWQSDYEKSVVLKMFAFYFLSIFVYYWCMAFVYVPFGSKPITDFGYHALGVSFGEGSLTIAANTDEGGYMIDPDQCVEYSSVGFADLDGDGDMDAFHCEASGYITFLKNLGRGDLEKVEDHLNPFADFNDDDTRQSLLATHTSIAFADLDGDNDYDAFIGHAEGPIIYLENVGTDLSPTFILVESGNLDSNGAPNPFVDVSVGRRSNIAFADIEQDGDFDAVVGDENGTITFLRNVGTTKAPIFAVDTTWQASGTNANVAWLDYDDDGDYDLFVAQENGEVQYWKNEGIRTPNGEVRTAESFNVASDDNDKVAVMLGDFAAISFEDLNMDGSTELYAGEKTGFVNFLVEDAGNADKFDYVSGLDTFTNPLESAARRLQRFEQLIFNTFMVTQLAKLAVKTLLPLLLGNIGKSLSKRAAGEKEITKDMRRGDLLAEEIGSTEFETFLDFAEIGAQFSKLCFFSIVFPMAPLFALLTNIVEIRLDTFKMCYHSSRIIPRKNGGVDAWVSAFSVVTKVAVWVNVLIVMIPFKLYTKILDSSDRETTEMEGILAGFLVAFLVEHVGLGILEIVIPLIPTKSEEARNFAIIKNEVNHIQMVETQNLIFSAETEVGSAEPVGKLPVERDDETSSLEVVST